MNKYGGVYVILNLQQWVTAETVPPLQSAEINSNQSILRFMWLLVLKELYKFEHGYVLNILKLNF